MRTSNRYWIIGSVILLIDASPSLASTLYKCADTHGHATYTNFDRSSRLGECHLNPSPSDPTGRDKFLCYEPTGTSVVWGASTDVSFDSIKCIVLARDDSSSQDTIPSNPGSSLAKRWKLVSVSDDGSAYFFLDTLSILKKKGKIAAWFIVIFSKPQPSQSTYPFKEYRSAKFQYLMECGEKTSGALQGVYYAEADAQGSVVGSVTYKERDIELASVIPETIGEAMLANACKWSTQLHK